LQAIRAGFSVSHRNQLSGIYPAQSS
jgi:hypothetical protein